MGDGNIGDIVSEVSLWQTMNHEMGELIEGDNDT
jgi:hypothetical protein